MGSYEFVIVGKPIWLDVTEMSNVGVVLLLGLKSKAYQEPAGMAKVTAPPAMLTVVTLPLTQVFGDLNATFRAQRFKVKEWTGDVVIVIIKPVMSVFPVFRIYGY